MKILYFILLIAAVMFYPLFKDDLSFILLLTMVIFPVIMFITLAAARRKLDIKVTAFARRAVRGEKLELKISVKNPTILPLSCFTAVITYRCGNEPAGKYTVNIPIRARGEENIAVNITPKHCGIVECTLKKAVIKDIIGLTSMRIKLDRRIKTAVLPVKIPCAAAVENDADGSRILSPASGGDNAEVSGLRGYRDGDRMNRIHWKLSSRSSDFIVKEFTEPVGGKVLLLPDLCSCRTADEADTVLDVFAALAERLAEEDNGCCMVNHEVDRLFIPSAEALDDTLEQLAENIHYNCTPLTENFAAECAEGNISESYSHIVIIAAAMNSAPMKMIEQSAAADRVTVLCTGGEKDIPEDKSSDVIIYHICKNGAPVIPDGLIL